MLYDNNADTGYIWLKNCTIGNSSGFQTNYAGSLTNKNAYNSLFDQALVASTHWGVLSNCTSSASISADGTTFVLSYDTGTYTDRGHLYGLSDTTWVEPS